MCSARLSTGMIYFHIKLGLIKEEGSFQLSVCGEVKSENVCCARRVQGLTFD